MRYIRLLIEYDGTAYQGWQSQRSGRTIQDIIKNTIGGITGEPVKLTGASRTDAGVHALGQMAVFGTESKLSSDIIMRALNAKLPHDIRILDSSDIDRNFNPRFSALSKSYFYLISQKSKESAFLYKYIWDVKTELDLDDMKKASILLGEHDFSCFKASGCSSKNSLRKISSIDISRHRKISFMSANIKGDFIKIRIEADAFLRYMVRNIVGTLVEVGRRRIDSGKMKQILKSCDRKQAGPTAPANGLFLEKIIY